MSKILIENYRGFDIEFDTTYEKFQCICTEENSKESTSFTAVKKFVDDYKKNNQNFTPFFIESIPINYNYSRKKLKVIGLRKDGRYLAENVNGETEQISKSDFCRFMISISDNQKVLHKLSDFEKKVEAQRIENIELKKTLIEELKIITMEEHIKSFE